MFMSYERDASLESIKYADKHFKLCPFCQSNIPDWKVEISNVSSRMKKYSFLCRQCEGVIDIEAVDDNAFKTNNFKKIALGNVGRGQYNYKRRGTDVTLEELKEMCHDDSIDEEAASREMGGASGAFFGVNREPEREPVRRREPEPVRRREPEPVRHEPERRVETPRRVSSRSPFGYIGLGASIISVAAVLFVIVSLIGNKGSLTTYSLAYISFPIFGIIMSNLGLKRRSNAVASRVGLFLSIFCLMMFIIFITVDIINRL